MAKAKGRPRRRLGRALLLMALAVAAALLAALLLEDAPAHPASALLMERGVLIDPGHGGFDVGAIGASGQEEDKLNLRMALALREELQSRGIPTTLLREDDGALGESKEADMEARAAAIASSQAAVMVSIHMNSFPDDPSVRGPQMVFQRESAASEAFARALQPYLNEAAGTSRQPMAQNLFVLRAAEGVLPAALIECGFLTNAQEEQLLASDAYRKKLAAAIAEGIAAYCA